MHGYTYYVHAWLCCVPYAYFIPYAYGTYRTRTVRTIRVWYVFLYHTRDHTRMVVPYAYTVSHSIKISIRTRGSIPNAYYAQKAMYIITSTSLLAIL